MLHLIEQGVDAFYSLLPRALKSKLFADHVLVVAHRGAHDKAQNIIENTDAAFANALQLGCWGIELDIHATADGVLVVHHDPDLKRLWGKALLIKQHSYADLKAAVPELPTLAEVVARYGRHLHLFIEIKAPFDAEVALEETLRSLTPGEDYHLISLDEPDLARLKLFPREAMLLVSQHNNTRRFCKLSIEKGYGGLLGHYVLLSKKLLKRLQAAHQQIGIGFVDSKYGLYRALNRNTVWLFTNKAKELCHQLDLLRAGLRE